MSAPHSRREFLQNQAAGIGAGLLSVPLLGSAASFAAPPAEPADNSARTDGKKKPPKLKKAVKYGMIRENISILEKFEMLKELGFDGVEFGAPNSLNTEEVLAARDKTGLPIHGVVDSVHWRQTLSDPDPEVRARGRAGLESALRTAKEYGATSVLLVPAVVNKSVSYGDAYRRSQKEIGKVLPLAEELDIPILLENVWNNFLLSPVEMARYVDEFQSRKIGVYFDVGNIVRYGWPEHWILELGDRIGKLDVKEYSRELQNSKGPRAGFGVKIGDGDCDWPAVMDALGQIGYEGWATAEVGGGGRERLKEIADRMDRAFGKA